MNRDELRAFFAGCVLIRGIGVDCHDQVDPAHCFTIADAMLAEHERRADVEKNAEDDRTETQRLLGTRPWCHYVMGKGDTHWYCGNPRPCPDHDKET